MKLDPLAELEAKLFAAAREEQPDAQLLQRVLRASREAGASALAAGSSAAPPAPKRRARVASSGLGWLLAAAALVAAGVLVWLRPLGSPGELAISAERAPRRSEPGEPSVSPSPSPPALSAPTPAVTAAPSTPAERTSPVPAVQPEAPERARPHAGRATAAPPRELSASNEAPVAPATLATEIGLLEQAREALRQGDAARAASLLDGYDAAHGTALTAEATLLRIEVLSAQGRSEQARALAQRFVAENPNSPLADRARRLSEAGAGAAGVSP